MSLPKLFDRVRMSVSGTPGTGDVTLGSAIQTSTKGYHQSFSDAGAANADSIRVAFEDGSAWEISDVTYSSTGPSLTSRSLIDSSTGSLLSLTSAAEVFCSPSKSWLEAAAADATNVAAAGAAMRAPRIGTTASGSTITADADDHDQYNVTALAAAATVAAPSGTPANGQRLVYRIKDNGTARDLDWNAIFRAVGVELPDTTVISKTLYVGCIYNAADSKWDVVAVAQEE